MKRHGKKLSPKMLGLVTMVLFLLVGLAAFEKEKLDSWLSLTSEEIAVEFAERAKLIGDDLTYVHTVKLNGVVVGKVTTLEQTEQGTMVAKLLVDSGTRAKLGAAPRAFLRPTLVTDGVQFVGLESDVEHPGEFTQDMIPLERTHLSVALDDVLVHLSSDEARNGIRSFIGQTDSALAASRESIHGLVERGPANLTPAGVVLQSLRGTDQENDLTRLVVGFERFSQAMNEKDLQFEQIIRDLGTTSRALADGSPALRDALAGGPETLRVAQAGFADLRPALDQLKVSAEDFRPSARQLSELVDELAPAVREARPVFDDLQDVLKDAAPTVRDAVPTAEHADEVFTDVGGVVMERLNGPIKDRLYSPFKGENEYKSGGAAFPLYQEIANFTSDLSDVFQRYDSNTAIARLEAGAGGQSVGGTKFPMSLEEYLEQAGLQRPDGPNEGPKAQSDGRGGEQGSNALPDPPSPPKPLKEPIEPKPLDAQLLGGNR